MRVALLVVMFALWGCQDQSSLASREAQAASTQWVPQDPDLAAIYLRSCRSCHTIAATRAPLTGDEAAWAPRMAKGMSVLVNNVVSGYGGMPPLGLCMDCSADQFAALIQFMAAPEPMQ